MFTLPEGHRATAEIEVKRSKFIALLERAQTESVARTVIAQQRRAHPTARHHCSAFIISAPGEPDREYSCDDGEPPSTAGTPILNAIKCADLSNVVAVVTRYFGGTLLGTGGLARAYSDATIAAIEKAEIVEIRQLDLVQITVPVELAGKVDAQIRRAGWGIRDSKWGSEVAFQVALEPTQVDELANLVAVGTQNVPRISVLGKISHEVKGPKRT